MKTRSFFFLSSLFAAFAFSSAVFAWNEPDGFRDIKWKSSPEEVKAAIRDNWQKRREAGEIVVYTDIRELHDNDRVFALYARDKVGQVPVDLFFSFLDLKFSHLLVSFDAKDFSTLKVAFLEKYGTPTDSKVSTVQTKMGAQYTNEELIWAGKVVTISLTRYSRKVTEGVASFVTKEWELYLLEAAKAKTKKAVKDL